MQIQLDPRQPHPDAHYSTSTTPPPASSSIYAISPLPLLVFCSRSRTASTSIGGFNPSPYARFHRRNLGIPIQGPYCEDRSKWRRILSFIERCSWCTGSGDVSVPNQQSMWLLQRTKKLDESNNYLLDFCACPPLPSNTASTANPRSSLLSPLPRL
jgi:hypothetical protein